MLKQFFIYAPPVVRYPRRSARELLTSTQLFFLTLRLANSAEAWRRWPATAGRAMAARATRRRATDILQREARRAARASREGGAGACLAEGAAGRPPGGGQPGESRGSGRCGLPA